jgi:hypothetical protein
LHAAIRRSIPCGRNQHRVGKEISKVVQNSGTNKIESVEFMRIIESSKTPTFLDKKGNQTRIEPLALL